MSIAAAVGLRRALLRIPRTTRFITRYLRFRSMNRRAGRDSELPVHLRDLHPCLDESTPVTAFDPHYLYHCAWAARVLATSRPNRHVDFASSLNFVTIVSAFLAVEFYDIRPAQVGLPGLACLPGDLTRLNIADDSVRSLSCMHVLEHVGLGRYGDPLDPQGDRKAAHELQRIASPGGDLLIVVPVGVPRVCFNAHRVYAYKQVLGLFERCSVRQFALIPDDALREGMVWEATEAQADQQEWGCGCFWLRKY